MIQHNEVAHTATHMLDSIISSMFFPIKVTSQDKVIFFWNL